ncbi:KISc [Musa troglodytarum]|uniref:KISc n=1 Tax=Musa troglodytarum TaxID=320322 RepID=A0A9E7L6L2_9LILI|nr:KISc [Musa troglodytarum]
MESSACWRTTKKLVENEPLCLTFTHPEVVICANYLLPTFKAVQLEIKDATAAQKTIEATTHVPRGMIRVQHVIRKASEY